MEQPLVSIQQESVAKIIIFNHDNEVLVLRTSEWRDNPRKSLKPDLPGGMVDRDETPEQAVLREVMEETGVEIKKDDVTMLYTETMYHESTNNSVSKFLYVTKVSDVTISLSWEHDEYYWRPFDEFVQTEWRPFYRTAITYAVKHNLFAGYLT